MSVSIDVVKNYFYQSMANRGVAVEDMGYGLKVARNYESTFLIPIDTLGNMARVWHERNPNVKYEVLHENHVISYTNKKSHHFHVFTKKEAIVEFICTHRGMDDRIKQSNKKMKGGIAYV